MSKFKSRFKTSVQDLIKDDVVVDRYWKPTNGSIIRILPATEGDKLPWVEIHHYGFKRNGQWYINNSLTTLGQADPVDEMNQRNWAESKQLGSRRRTCYYCNVYVIDDPSDPANNGKVFVMRFGRQIYELIKDQLDEECNVTDLWEGKNLKIRIKSGDFPSYLSSTWTEAGPLADDETMEKIWNSQYRLDTMFDPDEKDYAFKTYEELKQRLDLVMGEVT